MEESSHEPRRPSHLHRMLRLTPGQVPKSVLSPAGCAFDTASLAAFALTVGPVFVAFFVFGVSRWQRVSSGEGFGWFLAFVGAFAVEMLIEFTLIEPARTTERIARRRVGLGVRKPET